MSVAFRKLTDSKIPFGDEEFDFVYSINVIHHIVNPEDRKDAFSELNRVLKPGGILILHEINTDNILFRLYMCYIFPITKSIDEGTEWWISPRALPRTQGIRWSPKVHYYTFTPDFLPPFILKLLHPIEQRLEKSALRRWSAHYMAIGRKQ